MVRIGAGKAYSAGRRLSDAPNGFADLHEARSSDAAEPPSPELEGEEESSDEGESDDDEFAVVHGKLKSRSWT